MKDLLKRPLTFEKIEFWSVTFVYAFIIYVCTYNIFVTVTTGSVYTAIARQYAANSVPYSPITNEFLPKVFSATVYYGSFLLLNFYIIKPIVAGRQILLNIFFAIVIIIIAFAALGVLATWTESYKLAHLSEKYVYRRIFKAQFITVMWASLLLLLYNAAKHSLIYLSKTFYKDVVLTQLHRECLAALGVWFFSIAYLMTISRWSMLISWAEVGLFSIALYWFSYQYLIPQVVAKGQPLKAFLTKVFIVLVLSLFPVAILMSVVVRLEAALMINALNVGVSLFVVAPFTWFVYGHRAQKTAELTGLKTALNQSSANVDLLRSQINPHFLFNALNTLYGTALQENADRTSEGIQRLGDMMRFMLQENVQEQISLMREVDYLNNYIALQKLRTQTSADITIHTEIEEQINGLQIAPMLLIPFVENAFKHGISLRNPSHIKVTLNTKGSELFFDVYNSTHIKPDNDPEQNKSGIGLENVKQRLQLVYPGRHELVIRESAKEFFVHLTLNLN